MCDIWILTQNLATKRTQEMTVGFFANILPGIFVYYIIYIYLHKNLAKQSNLRS